MFSVNIESVSKELQTALQEKINQKTKPLGSLGQLEHLALQIGLIQNTLKPRLNAPHALIFAADHGLADLGLSLYPAEVTAQMVHNFVGGGAAINVFCKANGLELLVVDAGVRADLSTLGGIVHQKIANGTRCALYEPAMSQEECEQALIRGADLVEDIAQKRCNVIAFGEMGIGNTSSAALLMQCLTKIPLALCIGRGTGLDDAGLQHKIAILGQILENYTKDAHALETLANVGGFEIAQMVGAMLKAAEMRMIIVVDGFICTAALLVAHALAPQILDYCVFAHCSDESGHIHALNFLGAKPLLKLGLRLGEGSGAALAYPLLVAAVAFLNNMASFASAGVSKAQ